MLVIDFAAPRAITLEDDLFLRDFSINAMAVPVLEPARLLDPCNGISDLQKKVIRASSPNSFANDPVRTIRAVRFAADLHFRIEPQTLKWLKESVNKIPNISPERVRDEIFKIFEGNQPAAAIHVLDKLAIIETIFPEIIPQQRLPHADTDSVDMWQHTLKVVNGLQSLIKVLVGTYHPESAANLVLGNAVQELGRYRQPLEILLKSCLVPDRPRRGLLYMVSLLQNVSSIEAKQPDENGSSQLPGHVQADLRIAEKICQQYKLSREETHWIVQGVQSQKIIHELAARKTR